MADDKTQTSPQAPPEGGSYDVIRARLAKQADELRKRVDALNARRKTTFGGAELSLLATERIRTENNCVPRDIVNVEGRLLFAYNVFLGLKPQTQLDDVFSLHEFKQGSTDGDATFEFQSIPLADTFLADSQFGRDFRELYQYYKDAKLQEAWITDGKLLAVFQTGLRTQDVRVLRFALSSSGAPKYVDNRGERDHVYPRGHDFEWKRTTRDNHVLGRHPHVNILDEIFVETVGGDLTVKVEDNTEDGLGIYREPVEDAHQTLDDAEIHFAKLGALILLKVLPYREQKWRYLVFNARTKSVSRVDAIGVACIELPESHGIIFPGGFLLQTGETKVFDGAHADLEFKRAVRSPNGEDVLYVFHHKADGRTLLLPYNLIRKEVQTPIHCHGFTLFDDGKLVLFRAVSEEPTRVHPMQIWKTPFTSDEFAARAPTDGSFLAKIGNVDLVRAISDAYSIERGLRSSSPTRELYEDLIATTTRALDTYYWLGHHEAENLRETLETIKRTAELVIDEFEKVVAVKRRAFEALEEAKTAQVALLRDLRPEDGKRIQDFTGAMSALRRQRGRLISLREIKAIDLAAVDDLEKAVITAFERVSHGCVQFLLGADALEPLFVELERVVALLPEATKAKDLEPVAKDLEALSEGLTLLSETVAGLEVDDPTSRTRILESISEVFAQTNRARALLANRRKQLLGQEGRAEFAAQFKLFGQTVDSALSLATSPEACDEQLSRLMVQLEELEGRFSEFDEFIEQLTRRREEVYEAIGAKKQELLEARQRRAQNLMSAAERILAGIKRRAQSATELDELNAFFASDPMVHKLRQISEQLLELKDSVKADELASRLKATQQDGLRNLRDKRDLFDGGESVIKLGKHRFNVHTQPFELTIVPRGDGMAFHLTGTDYHDEIDDAEFNTLRPYWTQQLVSETPEVYRGEYLAYSILRAAKSTQAELDPKKLEQAALGGESEILGLVRKFAANRYDEGYERGLHDVDAARILERLVTLVSSAGLLRFAPAPRAMACLFWAFGGRDAEKERWHRRAMSLGRLRSVLAHTPAIGALAQELSLAILEHQKSLGRSPSGVEISLAGEYLVEELTRDEVRFRTGGEALTLSEGFLDYLNLEALRIRFDEDLRALEGRAADQLDLAEAWIRGFLASNKRDGMQTLEVAALEAATILVTGRVLLREPTTALTATVVDGLLGQHPRIIEGRMDLRLDELLLRLEKFSDERVPGFQKFRVTRTRLVDRERARLRLHELLPRVLTSFVRNRLIDEVYLPLIGDNLAKQIGAVGAKKRTDLMGMLLLVSPPGYGKTTLMEYVASRVGMVFMKVNGPALGHGVVSIDPAEAPNATARQEVEKINLAFEMGNNVMLYLDDIQHTNPELLQKFISLCDAQRKIEGVWRDRTKTYDLRGKKFCVVMAGNPYTESGEKFRIPDMLANRADTYNLGDILGGKEDIFALSYIENAVTSNATLAPLAARTQQDLHKLARMARGEDVPRTELEHDYSRAEVDEILSVLRHLFAAQKVVLRVNQQYIASAATDDRFRSEPAFKLQGSYRNMNKLAEKIVSVMNEAELDQVLSDHYTSEAQTLTTGAEHNLLKLAEMRDKLTPEARARWEDIKAGFKRVQLQGEGGDDPAARVAATLAGLAQELDRIARAVDRGAEKASAKDVGTWLRPQLEKLDQALTALSTPKLDVRVESPTDPALVALVKKQAEQLEGALAPLARSSSLSMDAIRALGPPLIELVELLRLEALRARAGRTLEVSAGVVGPAPRQHGPVHPEERPAAAARVAGAQTPHAAPPFAADGAAQATHPTFQSPAGLPRAERSAMPTAPGRGPMRGPPPARAAAQGRPPIDPRRAPPARKPTSDDDPTGSAEPAE
ncbi:MAG: DNA repair ATPase [Deltaproteobacteria bacterium]|nr:DNA repair ATPase [Deltaproteobacteria bacterium]